MLGTELVIRENSGPAPEITVILHLVLVEQKMSLALDISAILCSNPDPCKNLSRKV